MKRLTLPLPPNPADFVSNQLAYNRAIYDWMQRVKVSCEGTLNLNMSPCITPILSTGFTTSSIVSGTSTGTDIANALCTLIAMLTAKGIISPSITKQG